MKLGLVFGGGGAKGAYEIGVWKALRELSISIDAVCGTSIGALNGCLFAQGEFEKALSIWEKISPDIVMEQGVSFDFDYDLLVSQKTQIDSFLDSVIKEKRVDVSPFLELIRSSLNEDVLRVSEIGYGLCTLNVSNRLPCLLTMDEIPKGRVAEFLYASAACFPVFPLAEIDGEKYVDGGYFDNLPIQLAAKMGCDAFIAVILNEKELDNDHLTFSNVTFIQPYHSLTSFLNFSMSASLANIDHGYLDAMKKFGRYDGYAYTFIKESINYNSLLFHRFKRCYVHLYYGDSKSSVRKIISEIKVNDVFKKYFYKYDSISFEDVIVRIAELMGEKFNFDYNYVYEFNSFVKMLRATFEVYEELFDTTIESGLEDLSVSLVYEKLSIVNSSMIVVFLYKQLVKEQGKMNSILRAWSLVHEKEVLCALLMYTLYRTSNWDEDRKRLATITMDGI